MGDSVYEVAEKKCGAGVLTLRSVERGKCGAAAGRSALRNNFLSAFSAETKSGSTREQFFIYEYLFTINWHIHNR